MSRRERNRFASTQQDVFLDFSETGRFQVMNNNTNETLAIGTWKLLPSGIMWKFPIQQTVSSAITMIRCHIDMILNPFGNRPRMVRVSHGKAW